MRRAHDSIIGAVDELQRLWLTGLVAVCAALPAGHELHGRPDDGPSRLAPLREGANYLLILHEDGTLAMYGHLTHDGALVEIGAHVAVGQTIARSGHSGQSTAPHLHFEVMRCPLGAPPCESVPVLFRNTVPTPCGLEVGVSYPAWAF